MANGDADCLPLVGSPWRRDQFNRFQEGCVRVHFARWKSSSQPSSHQRMFHPKGIKFLPYIRGLHVKISEKKRSVMGSSLPKGLRKEVLVRGDMTRGVKRGDSVTVDCVGSIEGGDKFWSTKDPGQAALTFPCGVGKVIKGWDEGVLTMKRGEMARFVIPPSLGYGANGFPAWRIPPNTTLVFEIQLLEINGACK